MSVYVLISVEDGILGYVEVYRDPEEARAAAYSLAARLGLTIEAPPDEPTWTPERGVVRRYDCHWWEDEKDVWVQELPVR